MLMESTDLRWGVGQRLAFIESRLFWEGAINRGDLVTGFDISVPQASKDLALYQQRAPDNLRYDAGRKCYVATDSFTLRFITPDPDAYLTALTGGAEVLPIPHRRIDAQVLRAIAAAVREGRSIEVTYQSMVAERAGPAPRRISPHAFAHDGARWHMRAFCHERGAFLDFILSRCLAARDPGPVDRVQPRDTAWQAMFSLVLMPNPSLTPAQRQVVADDYAMTGGEVVLNVRLALLNYVHRRLRLDPGERENPREVPIVVKNRAAYDEALKQTWVMPD